METVFVIILGICAASASIRLLYTALEYDTKYEAWSMVIAFLSLIIIAVSTATFISNSKPIEVNNTHGLYSLELHRAYHISQIYENDDAAYYWVEHIDGKSGIYMAKDKPFLPDGYYKIEIRIRDKLLPNIKERKFVLICEDEGKC